VDRVAVLPAMETEAWGWRWTMSNTCGNWSKCFSRRWLL